MLRKRFREVSCDRMDTPGKTKGKKNLNRFMKGDLVQAL